MSREDILNGIRENPRYPEGRGALMSALHAVQDSENWLSQEALSSVAEKLNLPPATVKGVATFYAMYRKQPVGKYLIQVCTNVACMVMGAERFLDILKKEYGLEPGGTTPDGKFSLVVMECIGACGTAPAMLVNNNFYESLNEKKLLKILGEYK